MRWPRRPAGAAAKGQQRGGGALHGGYREGAEAEGQGKGCREAGGCGGEAARESRVRRCGRSRGGVAGGGAQEGAGASRPAAGGAGGDAARAGRPSGGARQGSGRVGAPCGGAAPSSGRAHAARRDARGQSSPVRPLGNLLLRIDSIRFLFSVIGFGDLCG
jgi:hypothetical protein